MLIFLPILRVLVGATNLVLVGDVDRAVVGCRAGTAGGTFLPGVFGSSSFFVGVTWELTKKLDLVKQKQVELEVFFIVFDSPLFNSSNIRYLISRWHIT